MPDESAAEPHAWVRLALPPSAGDRVTDVTALLEELRVPGAVRHSRFDGDGTFGFVPVSENGDVLAVRDDYGPIIGWERVDATTLMSSLEALVGPGSSLRGQPGAGDIDLPEAPCIDAIAWTTKDARDATALWGSMKKMSFLALPLGDGGTILSPQESADFDRAFVDNVWAASRALVVWRSGIESGAAFAAGLTVRQIVWRSPWVSIDPSRPGQTLENGVPLRTAMIEDVTTVDEDLDVWISKFRIPDDRAPLLRALVRREPSRGALAELIDLLGVDSSLLTVLDERERASGVVTIVPKGFAHQTVEELRRDIGLLPPRDGSWVRRHPRLWFGAWGVVTVGIGVFGAVGLAEDRATAWIPTTVAVICAVRLAVYAVLAGVRRRAEPGDLAADAE